MKTGALSFLFVLLGALTVSSGIHIARDDRTLTKVVKLLQGMVIKSQMEGDADRDAYAKYKCYCDQNEVEKKREIQDLKTQIGVLGNQIEELKGSSGKLSEDVAQLKAQMAENKQTRDEAAALRTKEETLYTATKSDLTRALQQLTDAIAVLTAIGADQNLQAAADHQKFMAGYTPSLASLKTTVQTALVAASSFLKPGEMAKVTSFLQKGPSFTGTYAAQSGEVVGILSQMRDTFSSNLDSATATENAAKEAHAKFMATKLDEYKAMQSTFDTKQAQLGNNDNDLSSKKTSLTAASQQLLDSENFLSTLLPMCAAKAKEYDERIAMRANEEAALAKAIAILNSDLAFEAFGKVKATRTGEMSFFLQTSAFRRAAISKGAAATTLAHRLQMTADAHHLLRLRAVAALVRAGNPFVTVIAEIEKMQKLIQEEAKLDKQKLDWCTGERSTNNANLATKKDDINELNSQITSLTDAIENPQIGLVKLIQDDEAALTANEANKKSATATRREENVDYQQEVANCVEAETLLAKAHAVIKKFYSTIPQQQPTSLVQKEDPAPPSAFENGYRGQGNNGDAVLTILEFLMTEVRKEETIAHSDEEAAQHAYEDDMSKLLETETSLQASLVVLQAALAHSNLELEGAKEDLEKTTQQKISIERYLEDIKPGCDFITTNYDGREANRGDESAALTKAVKLIKESPAYTAALADGKSYQS